MVLNRKTTQLINKYINGLKIEKLNQIDKYTKNFFIKNINKLSHDKTFLIELYKIVYMKIQNKYLKIVDTKIKKALKNNINLG